jgi:hypothetical protein
MSIDFRKAVKNREYMLNELRFQPKVPKAPYVFLTTPQRFLDLVPALQFMPMVGSYVFAEDRYLNPSNMKWVSSTKSRTDFYKELGDAAQGPSITKLMAWPDAKDPHWNDQKNVLVCAGLPAFKLPEYVAKNKSAPASRKVYLMAALRQIFAQYTGGVMIVDFTITDPFTNMIAEFVFYANRMDFAALKAFFDGFEVVFVFPANDPKDATLKAAMVPWFDDPKKDQATKSAIAKILKDNVFLGKEPTVDEAPADPDAPAPANGPSPETPDAVLDIDDVVSSAAVSDFDRMETAAKQFVEEKKPIREKAASEFLQGVKPAPEPLSVTGVEEEVVINQGVKTAVMNKVTAGYRAKRFHKDLVSLASSFEKDPETPVVLKRMALEPSNTALDHKDTLTVEFVDQRNRIHKLNLDVPRVSHDGYMYINGNKKFIAKQLTQLPVIKEAPDRVQITTNYNKVFLFRKGEKVGPREERLMKTFVGSAIKGVRVVYGNSYTGNIGADVDVPYNYVARRINTLSFLGQGVRTETGFVFSQQTAKAIIDTEGLSVPKGMILVGYKKKDGKVIETLLETVADRMTKWYSPDGKKPSPFPSEDLFTVIEKTMDAHWSPEARDKYAEKKGGKTYAWTDVRIASSSVPLGILLGFFLGIREALDLAQIKYRVDAPRYRATGNEKVLKFDDASYVIDCEGDTAKELLANGLLALDGTGFRSEDAEVRGTVYVKYFGDYTGSRNNAKALLNFQSAMIDPITEGILKEMGLPTEFPALLVYANNLLGDFSHRRKNDMANFRLRDTEVVSVATYRALVDSFKEYKRGTRSGVPVQMNTAKNAVTKHLISMPNVEDFSVLSPFLEMELRSKATYKGPSGLAVEFGPL